MDRIVPILHRLLFQAPGIYLAWPAGAMVLGTIVARLSRDHAIEGKMS